MSGRSPGLERLPFRNSGRSYTEIRRHAAPVTFRCDLRLDAIESSTRSPATRAMAPVGSGRGSRCEVKKLSGGPAEQSIGKADRRSLRRRGNQSAAPSPTASANIPWSLGWTASVSLVLWSPSSARGIRPFRHHRDSEGGVNVCIHSIPQRFHHLTDQMNGRSRMRRSSACVLASIIALALGHSPGVRAAGPAVFTVPVDETSSMEACDFPVENHTTGAIRIHDFFDEQGNLVREIANYNLKITYTNSLTGESVTSRSAGPDILQVNPDNSANLLSIGLLARIVVPGQDCWRRRPGRWRYSSRTRPTKSRTCSSRQVRTMTTQPSTLLSVRLSADLYDHHRLWTIGPPKVMRDRQSWWVCMGILQSRLHDHVSSAGFRNAELESDVPADVLRRRDVWTDL